MNDRRHSIAPGALIVALVLALAGACGKDDRAAKGGASDTVAYRAAVGQADTAARMSALERFLEDYPQSSFRRSAYRRSFELKEAKNPDDALALVQRGLEKEKDPSVRGILHVSLFEHARDHAAAEVPAVARAALTDPTPLSSDVYNSIAWELAESGEHLDLALELADKAVATASDPSDKASCIDTQAWVYLKQGDAAKAVELLETAKKTAPEPIEEIDVHLAKAYQAAGKKAEAKDIYVALLLDQENPEFREAVTQLSRDLGSSPAPIFRDIDRKREERAKPAPDFTLKDYSGKDVHLSDFKGSIVLVNFWHPT